MQTPLKWLCRTQRTKPESGIRPQVSILCAGASPWVAPDRKWRSFWFLSPYWLSQTAKCPFLPKQCFSTRYIKAALAPVFVHQNFSYFLRLISTKVVIERTFKEFLLLVKILSFGPVKKERRISEKHQETLFFVNLKRWGEFLIKN